MSKDMPTAGYYNYTPMFVGVDGSDPAVKDIVPSTQDKSVTDLGGAVISMFVLDTNRKFAKTFSWMTEEQITLLLRESHFRLRHLIKSHLHMLVRSTRQRMISLRLPQVTIW